jgi:hypothetical protein
MSKFKYSKTIRPRKTDSFIYDATLKNRLNKFRGYTLDKPIHLYRMWFHLVRLVVDCENSKISFGGEKKQKVRLNKKFYKDWEIEKYLHASFDEWFQDKIELFAEREVELVKEGDKSEEHLYLKFHKSQRKEDVLRQIRVLLKEGLFKSGSKFPITGKHKYINLHQQYNAFILRQDGDLDGMGISQWMFDNYSKYSKNVSTSYSSMRRVYRASEELVVEVSKGIF